MLTCAVSSSLTGIGDQQSSSSPLHPPATPVPLKQSAALARLARARCPARQTFCESLIVPLPRVHATPHLRPTRTSGCLTPWFARASWDCPSTSTTTTAAADSAAPMRATQHHVIFCTRSAARSGLLRLSSALLSRAWASPARAAPAGPSLGVLLSFESRLRAAPRTAVPTGFRPADP